MSELLLCMSQDDAKHPYKFKATNKSVYSFEESAYHCYYYWKQSIDDFVSDEFILWVREELGLSFLASKIKEIAKIQNYSDRLIVFLSQLDYFDQSQLAKLKAQLGEWERRLEWERLKERGDYLMQNNEPDKAALLYSRALSFRENRELLNNLAIAQMKMRSYPEAIENFEKVISFGEQGVQQYLNLAEAVVYNGDFEKALKILKTAESIDRNHPDIQLLYGELNMQTDNVRYSIDYFKKALNIQYNEYYIYRLADVYVNLRQYDKAVETLNDIQQKDKKFLVRLADIHAKANNMPAAIKAMERALAFDPDNIDLWIKVAMYHRLDYDIGKADAAIAKAILLDANNEMAQLESARIKKSQGKTKDYQIVLHNILKGFKRKYRDLINMD